MDGIAASHGCLPKYPVPLRRQLRLMSLWPRAIVVTSMQKTRPFHRALIAAALLALPIFPAARAADEDFGKFDPGEVPSLKPASDAGEKAIAKMQIPKGLKV